MPSTNFLQHNKTLYLALERLLVLEHVDELRVVDLKQHAGDLSSKVREHSLDQREDPLAKHLLLLLGRGSGQHGRGQRLLALDEHSGLGLRNLLDDGLRDSHDLGRVADVRSVLVVGRGAALGNVGHHGLGLHGGHWLRLHGRPLGGHDWHHLSPGHHLSHARSSDGSGSAELVRDVHVGARVASSLLWPTLLTGADSLRLSEEALRLGHGGNVVAARLSEAHLKKEQESN